MSDDSVTIEINVDVERFMASIARMTPHTQDAAIRFHDGMRAFARMSLMASGRMAWLAAELDAPSRRSAMHAAYHAKTRRRGKR